MKRLKRGLGILAALLLAGGAAIYVAGRASDGPLGFFSGGPFASGEVVVDRIDDWSFLTEVETVELQLLEPARSRTVWVVVEDGRAYIPCGLPYFRLWKQWPHQAVVDGAALVRVGSRIHPVELALVEATAEFAAVQGRLAAKYGSSAEDMTADDLWLFRLDERRP